MAVTSAISDLFSSFYELLASMVNTVYTLAHTIIMAFVNFITGIFTLIADVFTGLIEMAGGIGKFLVSNIALLAIGVAGAFLYVRYTAQGQKLVQDGKKTN